ncbi:NAD(P)/FAD-dependent oxidoreductase [Thalassotalea atypica]|uniref:NAD(P)/FAD-dependent oxidoreductase n=1 Tax=Thalassotalea atypica TaxID=2054316 RepID=UPI0025737EEB|nr:FAD-binding oxidoreductase [Thalassotalea atypica]
MTVIHTNEYPESYYVSSINRVPTYSSLEESLTADVCIVGGGFSGIASALELAERGYSVVVLEARKVAWGASGRNGGQIIRGVGHDLSIFKNQIGQEGVDAISAMGFEANKIVIDRIKKYDISCDLRLGYCDLATRPKDMRSLEKDYEHLSQTYYGRNVTLLDKSQLKQNVVGSDRYIGGLEDLASGHLHPLNFCLGEAEIAVSLGVKIFQDSPVVKIDKGSTVTVSTSSGQVHAKQLILAGNAYLGDLEPKISGKVLPAGSYIIATEQLPESVYQTLLPQNHAVCDMKIDLDYFRLSADKRMLFGGMCNYSGRDPKSIKAALLPKMLKIFPQLVNTQIEYQWGGMIGIGANRLPQIGRIDRNIYYAQAYSGHGVNVTHLAAKLLAESIHGETHRLEHFAKVKHMTFPGGKYLRSPLLALGMMYHKMIDAF